MKKIDPNEKIIFKEKVKELNPKEIAKKREIAKKELEKVTLAKELSDFEKEEATKIEKQLLDQGYNKRISSLISIDEVNDET